MQKPYGWVSRPERGQFARVGGGGGATAASVGCVTSTPPSLWMAASSVVAMVEIAERALAEELTELAERPRVTSWSPM